MTKPFNVKYLFILFVLCPLLSFAQEKKANLITVTPNDTANIFDYISTLLRAEGYKVDPPFRGIVYTKPRTLGRYISTTVYYSFKVEGNFISIRGYYNFNRMQERAIYNYGFEPAWEEMDRLAKMLGTVTYSKEK